MMSSLSWSYSKSADDSGHVFFFFFFFFFLSSSWSWISKWFEYRDRTWGILSRDRLPKTLTQSFLLDRKSTIGFRALNHKPRTRYWIHRLDPYPQAQVSYQCSYWPKTSKRWTRWTAIVMQMGKVFITQVKKSTPSSSSSLFSFASWACDER